MGHIEPCSSSYLAYWTALWLDGTLLAGHAVAAWDEAGVSRQLTHKARLYKEHHTRWSSLTVNGRLLHVLCIILCN